MLVDFNIRNDEESSCGCGGCGCGGGK